MVEVDPGTGTQSLFSSGGLLAEPFGLTVVGTPARITGSFYDDTGTVANDFDAADAGMPGETVQLYADNQNGSLDGGDTLLETRTTEGDGSYDFTGYANGDYLVVATPPAARNAVKDADGPANGNHVIALTLNSADSDANDFLFRSPPPTAARLTHFTAVLAGSGHARLTWGTLVESRVLGFRVERSAPNGGWERITAQLIPATGWDRQPQSYSLADTDAPAELGLAYRLMEVDFGGREHVLAETVLRTATTLTLRTKGQGLSLDLRGGPQASVTVETAAAVTGPWARLRTFTLDGSGAATLSLDHDSRQPARYFRVLDE